MNPFKTLSAKENKMLLKFPAYISLLAANWNDKLDDVEKESAIKLAHIKTFSSDPLLAEFYKEADKVFEKNIEQLDKTLPKEKENRSVAIELEISNLEKIVSKLRKEYVSVMCNSMKSFKEHVSKAHNSVLVNFIFPIAIPGLSV